MREFDKINFFEYSKNTVKNTVEQIKNKGGCYMKKSRHEKSAKKITEEREPTPLTRSESFKVAADLLFDIEKGKTKREKPSARKKFPVSAKKIERKKAKRFIRKALIVGNAIIKGKKDASKQLENLSRML